MENKFNSIKDLFSEIEFYESKGYYKLADAVLQKIKIYAHDANIGKDIGYQDFAKSFNANAFYNLIKQIPACMNLYFPQNKNPLITPDFNDCIESQYKITRNYEQAVTNCYKQRNNLFNSIGGIQNSQSYSDCFNALYNFQINKAKQADQAVKNSQPPPGQEQINNPF